MAEADAEAEYVNHHPKKIAFIFSAMRHFASTLRASGWKVLYSKVDDPQNSQNILGEILESKQSNPTKSKASITEVKTETEIKKKNTKSDLILGMAHLRSKRPL